MSGYDEGAGDYEEYSDDVAREAGRKQKKAERIAGGIANEQPVTTSTGRVVSPPARGHGDLVMSILKLVLFVIILALSAACIKQIRDGRDAGTSNPCFNAANSTFGLLVGILTVSCIAFAHAVIIMVLAGAKRGPAVRYILALCVEPYCIILVILGGIILGFGHPYPGQFTQLPPASTATFINADDVCGGTDPYSLVYKTAAVTVAFAGFLMLLIPLMVVLACYNDIVNNPKLVMAKEIAMEEGRAAKAKANRGRGNEPMAEHAVKKGRSKGRAAARAADSELSSALDEEES
jgi:hypothetical protein